MSEDAEHQKTRLSFIPVCAIGASAGGVAALQGLFRQLPTDLGLAYVVILHLSPDHPSALSEILSVCTRMPVLQVEDGPVLEPNHVYVIPPDRELAIDGDQVKAQDFSEPRGRRAPIDMFFRSVANGRGDGIAVVLSGAGADGASGVRAIKEAGGVIMVQEPAEAGFSSMPQQAIATGVADIVAPLARLAELLAEVARSKEAVRSLDMDDGANDLRRIMAFLRARTGHDFSSYKRATVMRRVQRRMQVCRTDTLAAYADQLLANPEEAKALLSDLLISVTMFFRDPHAFEALEEHVVRPLFDGLNADASEGLRVWTVGCATGEEAYSLAMLLREEATRRKIHVPIQIFASDLDEGALTTAREARYPRSIEADVSQARLDRFFVDEGTHYRVRKELRETVLFATHSVIKEPPFLRLDLITCRNLLIYLERSLQQQICTIFHYALKPGRFLFLGSAETADAAAELFAPVDRDARLYCARAHAVQTLPLLPQFAAPERLAALPPSFLANVRPTVSTALHLAALEQNAPASVLVDDGQNILHLSQNAGRFILHSAGPVSTQLTAVVRPELRLDLRMALTRAFDGGEPTLTHPAVVAMEGGKRRIALHAVPVAHEAHMGAHALVYFLDGGVLPEEDEPAFPPDPPPDQVRRLHGELKAAQEALLASRSGHDMAIQDLRATNEELQSINEEYRSTAEELETSKEELQSINEELHTVNAELKSKLESISVSHSDLQNLTAATEIGTLFLDPELRIKMFTPPIADLFPVTRTDIGRPITDFTHRLDYSGLEKDVREVLKHLAPVETEVRSKDGRRFAVRLRPYRTVEDRIDGTVVTFFDITARVVAEAALSRSEQQLRSLVEGIPQLVWRAFQDGQWVWVSPQWLDFTGQSMAQSTGWGWLAAVHPEDHAAVREAWDGARSHGQLDVEFRVRRAADHTWRWHQTRSVPVRLTAEAGQDGIIEWLGTTTDIEHLKMLQASQQMLVAELQHRTRNLLAVVRSVAQRSVEPSPGRDQLEARLAALGRVQGFLSRSPTFAVPLVGLIEAELAAAGDGTSNRVSIEGPPIELPGEGVQTVALALHELATNAVKYGAIAQPSGQLSVSWQVEAGDEDHRRLAIDWRESGVDLSGGPPVRRGYGTELITRALPYQLKAETKLEFDTDGVKCRIVLPAGAFIMPGEKRE